MNRGWETIVCIASGPSLTTDQIELIKASGHKTIAVSNNYKLLPNCNIVYSMDSCWWLHYYQDVCATVSDNTELWTSNKSKEFLERHNVRLKRPYPKELTGIEVNLKCQGLSKVDNEINHGGNSGFMAVSLAYKFGAKKIILVGYDFQHTDGKAHWFGDYDPKKLRMNAANPHWWPRPFGWLTKDLHLEGVKVLNATIETAIPDTEDCPRVKLKDVL